MSSPPQLPRKPEARTEKVEDLVEYVHRGRVRVPWFQRGLKWTSENVEVLFDSLYRGYPIGSLLFYKAPAKAERLKVGPLLVNGEEFSEAWWVVDGQQRITALAACLKRPLPLPSPPEDQYVLYFDSGEQRFRPAPLRGKIASTMVPLPILLDASTLTEWIFSWVHGQDKALRRIVFDAGSRIREYPIPLYLIEAGSREVAQEIFYRVNQAGEPLQWPEVHKALFGSEDTSPSTLPELADDLSEAGMGTLNEDRLLTCLFALRALDPTRNLHEHYRKAPEELQHAVQDALPVLRRVLSFLRRDAGIPHLRLLPKSILLDVLTRFFALHAEPAPRTRTLLARWFWRNVLDAGVYDDRTLRRRGIAAIDDDEEESAQRLLGLVRKEPPREFELPPAFDARADATRLVLLTLTHLGPRALLSGEPLDVASLLEQQDKSAFVKILKGARSRSPANRMIQPKGTEVRRLLVDRATSAGADDPVLASHAVDPYAAQLLVAGDGEAFLTRRAEQLTSEVRRLAERMAAWDHSDRPSIEHILLEEGVEA